MKFEQKPAAQNGWSQLVVEYNSLFYTLHMPTEVANEIMKGVSDIPFMEAMKKRMSEQYIPPVHSSLPEIDGFVKELGCTVRSCRGCGCLVGGGPTRCKRCVKELGYDE